ncbi:hypothetical protein BH11BAC1_BH11BAC1_07010 [soil metagenome]
MSKIMSISSMTLHFCFPGKIKVLPIDKNKFWKLLQHEDDHINALHQMVIITLNHEKIIFDEIYTATEHLHSSNRMDDCVAAFGGSWKCGLRKIKSSA